MGQKSSRRWGKPMASEQGCCVDRRCSETTCMNLPPGTTCGDCRHITRCGAIFGHVPTDTYCDWFPRKFSPAVVSLDTARRKHDESEEARLEQKVIERWTGPKKEIDDGK
jgi:hypothetical protein